MIKTNYLLHIPRTSIILGKCDSIFNNPPRTIFYHYNIYLLSLKMLLFSMPIPKHIFIMSGGEQNNNVNRLLL